jgi:MFS family permease
MVSAQVSSISQRRLVTRYLVLYFLFGVIVGVQLGAGNWVIRVFHYWGEEGGHLLMAFTMAGMLIGEVCGARLTRRYSSSKAVLFAAAAFALSAVVSFLAVFFWSPETNTAFNSVLLLVAALCVGTGLGTQHSSIDAWFSVSTRVTSERSPTDSEMGWGYTTYTSGFFVGQVLFFPLMYGFAWSSQIAQTIDHKTNPLTMPISASPYVFALAAALLIFIFRPYSFSRALIESVAEKVAERSNSVLGTFRRGGIAFVTMLLVGSCVSFVIFHIDTFAGPDLLPGSTVKEKAIALGILCFVTFILVGLFSWKLETNQRFRTLSPAARSGVLAASLICSVSLLGLILLGKRNSWFDWIGVATLLGFSSGFVNMLPQVVKWAILDCATIGDKAQASAILGVSKRLPNLFFSVAVVVLSSARATLESPNFAYKLLIAANLIALIALSVYYSRVRLYRLRIVYPTQVAIDQTLLATISDVPSTVLENLQHLPSKNGTSRLNLSVYSTSKDYIAQLIGSLRNRGGISSALPRRSRNS